MAGFAFPAFERDYEFVALRHPDEYPLCEGRVVSSKGLDIDVRDYDAHFVEEQVPYSNALHSRRRGPGRVPVRAAGALQPELRSAVARRPGGWRAGVGLYAAVPEPVPRTSSCASWR